MLHATQYTSRYIRHTHLYANITHVRYTLHAIRYAAIGMPRLSMLHAAAAIYLERPALFSQAI